jgi:hypothetical protein
VNGDCSVPANAEWVLLYLPFPHYQCRAHHARQIISSSL